MKRTFEIEKVPEKTDKILTSLRKDQHLSQTFEGSASNGRLKGFYTNLALINKMVIGYVKIKGQYDREKGDLRIVVIPSNLYWVVIIFSLIATITLAYEGIIREKLILIGSFLFLLFGFVITVAYLLESKSFIKHIERISNLVGEDNRK